MSEVQRNDGSAPGRDTLDEVSLRYKFKIRFFTPIIDALEINLRKRASVENAFLSWQSDIIKTRNSEGC